MRKLILLLLFPLALLGQGKISEMPAASSVTGTELMEVVQGGVNKKITLSQTGNTFYVPLARTLTINGTPYDLSANRSWSVGNVFTSGTYSNPSWITSFAATKITGTLLETQGGTGFNSYTVGDLLYASAPTTLQKLGIGTSGYALISNGTIPSWQPISTTLAGLSDVSLSGLASGDFLKYNGSSWINRTSAQVLSDIGAQATGQSWLLASGGTLTGNNNINGPYQISFGTTTPISGFNWTTTGQSSWILDNSNFDAEWTLTWDDGVVQRGQLFISPAANHGLIIDSGLTGDSRYTRAAFDQTEIIFESNYPSWAGAKYFADYSANFVNESLVSKRYVDNSSPTWKVTGTTTMTGTVTTAFGSNPWIITTGVTTGTDATSGLDFQANSLTTGYGMNLRSSSVTTGRLLRVASTSTAIDHTVGTSALASVVSSGANSTSSKTAIGQQILVTNTGTSSTNIPLYVSASGATNNYAIIVGAGRIGQGTSSPINHLHINGASITGVGSPGTAVVLQSTNGNALFQPRAGATTSFAGVEYLDTSGNSAVFTGYKESTGEFRFNNVATSGYIDFMIGSASKLTIANSGAIGISTSSPTANTRLDVRGIGTTTANIVRYANSSNTTRYTLNDQGDETLTGKSYIVGTALGGGSITDNWLNVTGTMPSTMTAQTNAVNMEVTGNGSSSQLSFALRVAYGAGYTGSSATGGANIFNANAGTNTTAPTMNAVSGNVGNSAFSRATTTGHNYGTISQAFGGNLSAGIIGQAQTAKNSAVNYGVIGLARNTGTSPQEVGGYFGLLSDATALPTNVSAALIANNGTSTADIFKARDNGTDVFAIQDGGSIALSGSAGTSGQVLTSAGSGAAPTWSTVSAGIGGSTGATDNLILRSDGTGGATLQNSTVVLGDNADITLGLSSTPNSSRSFQVDGSSSDIGISFTTKAAGAFTVASTTSNGFKTQNGTTIFQNTTATALAPVHVSTLAASTNTVDLEAVFEKQTVGTPGAGIGPSVGFAAETSSSNIEIGTILETSFSDIASTAEAATHKIQVMDRGTVTNKDRLALMGKLITLTESSATSVCSVTVPTSEVIGGEVVISVESNDATDFQLRTLRTVFSAVNKAGTLTITLGTPEEVVAVSSGTLTVTITATDAGSGVINFKANATSSLTQTVLRAQAYTIKNFGSTISSN